MDNATPSLATFNTLGLSPYSVKFKMSIDEFEKAVLQISKSYISDIEYAYIEYYKKDRLALVVWLPSNSDHLIARDSSGGKSVLQRPIRSLSPALRDFKKRFCADTFIGEERFRPADATHRFGEIITLADTAVSNVPFTGIVVNPTIFFDIIFDINGIAFNKEYNYGRNVKSKILIETQFSEKTGNVSGFDVQKIVEQRSNNIFSRHAIDTRQ